MNSSTPAGTMLQMENMSEKLVELFSSGMTLGEIYNYTEQDYEVVYNLGHNLYSQGRYLDAMKAFSFLVMHNQFERRFHNAMASSLQMLKMYNDAIQFYSMASVMDLTDPKPTYHTAECMIPLGMYAEALQALELVIKQSQAPEHAALLERAEALQQMVKKSHLADGQKPLVDPSKAFAESASVN